MQRFFKINFEESEAVYLRFIPNSDFDLEADGGMYLGVCESDQSYNIGNSLLTNDNQAQVNQINHVYSFKSTGNPMYMAITQINGGSGRNSTQDRVNMQVSGDAFFKSYKEFPIRYDAD